MENEESIITIGDIFRMIRKRIWAVAAVTVAFGILFFCLVQFWYNGNHQNYQMSYYISFPGLTAGPSQSTYPDGTAFRAEDTISLEILSQIKEQGAARSTRSTWKRCSRTTIFPLRRRI